MPPTTPRGTTPMPADTAYRLKLAPEASYDAGRGCLRIVASVEMPDREDEVVVPSTIRLDSYRANPVVIWCHDTKSYPVAKCEDDAGNFTCRLDEQGRLVQEWYFAATDEGRKAAELYRDKVLRGASIGFVSDGLEDVGPDEAFRLYGVRKRLKRHLGGELVETTACPVPMCPGALALGWLDVDKARAVTRAAGAGSWVTKSLAPFVGQATAGPTAGGADHGSPPADRGTTRAATVTEKELSTLDDAAGGAAVEAPAEDAPDEVKEAFRKVAHKAVDAAFDADDEAECKRQWKAARTAHKGYVRHKKGMGEPDADDADDDEGDDAPPPADLTTIAAQVQAQAVEIADLRALLATTIDTLDKVTG
jgi:hypothetical protein